MNGDKDPLISMAHSMGNIEGTLTALKEQNEKDHKDIKQRLEEGDKKFDHLCEENRKHEERLSAVEGRVQNVERSQQYIQGLARFINSHPKIVIAVILVTLALLTGLSVEELKALLEGL